MPFCVGRWRVEAGLNQLSSDGEARHVEPRVMELLVFLAESPGVTLSREQILETVWQGAAVVDAVLPRAVSELRAALGDDARDPRFVQTVPRRGYRLIAPVTPVSSHMPAKYRKLALLTAALVAAGAVLVMLIPGILRDSALQAVNSSVQIESVAVLPLEESTPVGRPFFAQGLTDSLTTSLARSRVVRVVSPRSVRGREDLDPQSLGVSLGVDAVLFGSVLHDEDDVGLTLELIATEDGTVLWAGNFRQPMRNVLALQAEIARQVVREIQGQIQGSERQGTAARAAGRAGSRDDESVVDPEAFERTLEARYYLSLRTGDGLRRSRELFERALLADREYAPAWAGLAECHVQLVNYLSLTPGQAYPAAREAAERAVALDPNSPESHAALGLVVLHQDWDLEAAEAAYRRAISLGPSYATAHQLYAELMSFQGRHDEALRMIRTARELDPFSPLLQAVEGVLLLGAGRYEESAALLGRVYDLDHSLVWTRRQRAYAFERMGRMREAIAERTALTFAEGESARRLRALTEQDGLRGFYRWSLTRPDLEDLPATLRAEYLAGAGEDEQALLWIDRAVEDKGEYLLHLHRSPAFDRLRDHPRFRGPLEAAGVDPSIPRH